MIIRYLNRIPEIIVTANSRTVAALDRGANNIETRAKGYSRVDTGTMRNGWQTAKLSNQARVVYNTVYYTIHNEYGTINMEAQPMLRPAIEETMPELIQDIKEAWG